jgi:hypothetical protein
MPSKDGKGRTLWDILTGQNKRDMTPLELQYHNPLKAKVGCTVTIDHDEQCAGVNFVIDRLSVYETRVQERKFHHTDYHLKGVTLDRDRPLRLRLRLIPDEDETNALRHKILLMNLYDERGWESTAEERENRWYGDKEFGAFFVESILGHEQGIFDVTQDDEGKPLTENRRYWRVEDVLDPYSARVTTMTDSDGSGKIDDNELAYSDVTYWDYHRETQDPKTAVQFIEYLTVEMNERTRYFTFLRGRAVGAFQVSVF